MPAKTKSKAAAKKTSSRKRAPKKAAAKRTSRSKPRKEGEIRKGDKFRAQGMSAVGVEFTVKANPTKEGVVVLANDQEEVVTSVEQLTASDSWVAV